MPSTKTLPAKMSSSAFLREQKPREAMALFSRNSCDGVWVSLFAMVGDLSLLFASVFAGRLEEIVRMAVFIAESDSVRNAGDAYRD